MNLNNAKMVYSVLESVISGFFYSTIIFIVPFGMLTGLSALMDPSLVLYEFLPEEVLFIPWIILSLLIVWGNVNIANLFRDSACKNKIFTIRDFDVHKYVNKGDERYVELFSEEISTFILNKRLNQLSSITKLHRSDGIGLAIKDIRNQTLLVSISSFLPDKKFDTNNTPILEIMISVEVPFLPWKRARFRANIILKGEIENLIEVFLNNKKISYSLD
jgi:hypothetical protein